MPTMRASSDTVEIPADHANTRMCVRARVFRAAGDLFYHKGIRAVSVDLVAKEADTTKMTLYRYFPSKEILVVEWLRHHSEEFSDYLQALSRQYPDDPRHRLQAFFDNAAKASATPGDRGCPIANAAIELTEPHHPARSVIESHKAELRAWLLRACQEMRAQAPEQLADGLFLLSEGAHVSSQTLGRSGPGQSIVAAAERLIGAHLAE
ncbi:MAG: TetR/AcrR family transcriptional regulator [Gallionellaceae bacterium]|jgi:AcrR family transcriptional regulator|nr:TetR/AcrR family transcriptional regulator [Gallionellaceae bacterium]